MKINVVELFSGIGSQAKALNKISKKREINVDIVKTCEWNTHALVAYHHIHNGTSISETIEKMDKEELVLKLLNYNLSHDTKSPMTERQLRTYNEKQLKLVLHSIEQNNNMVDITKVEASDIPADVDLMTYSFPCQDLSNMGSIHGYVDGIDPKKLTRSGLLWEVERILLERNENGTALPRFLLLENVTTLEAKKHKGNFNQWKARLEELGYYNQVYKMNARDFGIPQHRNRLLMLSVYVGTDKEKKEQIKDYFSHKNLNNLDYVKTLKIENYPLTHYLRTNYNNTTLLEEALESQPNNTSSRMKIWKNNSKIIDENNTVNSKVQTITTKQDRHPNSGNIYFDPQNDKSTYRFLTPRECMLLMGFDETDYEALINNNFITRGKSLFYSRDIVYRLAGNSIVVNVLEAVFDQVIDIQKFLINKN